MNIRKQVRIMIDDACYQEYYIYDGESLDIEVTKRVSKTIDKNTFLIQN